MKRQAKQGDRVVVEYIGTLDNGRIFDQRDGSQPLVFTIGAGEVFIALEQALTGMKVGEVKNVHISSQQAYGPRRDENLLSVPLEMFPPDRKLQVGEPLSIEIGGEAQQLMRVRAISEQAVLLDGNHDLAGCDLTFALQLTAIE